MVLLVFLLIFLITYEAAAQGLKDIKPPVSFPADYTLLIIALIIIFLFALILLSRFLIKRRKVKKENPPLPKKSAHEIAYEALDNLKKKGYFASGRIKEFYIELSDIVRHYLENRFFLRAPEMTTEEFLFALKDSDALNQRHKDLLREFLNHCDMVKFAKYGPSSQEVEKSFDSARRLIDETKADETAITEKT